MAKFCPNCGGQVKEGNAFCAHCGSKLSIIPAAPAESVPVAAPLPEASPVVEAIPDIETPVVVEPVSAEPISSVEPAPAVDQVYAAEPAPVYDQVPEFESAPAAEQFSAAEAVPVAEVEPAPAPAPAPTPAEPSPFASPAAPAVSAEPMRFEAPSGPVAVPATAESKSESPKKKSVGGLIALFVAVGVVALALIGVGVWAVVNGGFGIGGTIIERIERKDKVESGKKYAIYDEDFNDYIVEARWWDYDSTMDKPGIYNTDTETLAFSIEVNEDAEEEIYYAYYYSKDKTFDKDDLSKPVFSDTIPPEEFGDGKAYYNVDCSKKIQKGYYVVVVASDESLKRPYVVAYADVK